MGVIGEAKGFVRKAIERFFKVGERGSAVGAEVVGGPTTFLTMAYIVAANPAMMQAAGMPFAAALTGTCLGAAVMTVAMGVIANRPIALASGMGLNAIVGIVMAVGSKAGFVDARGDIEDVRPILAVDSVAAAAGGFIGASSITCYAESTSGAAAGARTGLSNLVVAPQRFWPARSSRPSWAWWACRTRAARSWWWAT